MIKLGNKVKDSITGFTGIAIGRTEWMYGCARVGVRSTELTDGKPVDDQWFDEQQLSVVEATLPQVSPKSSATTGGPREASPRAKDPVR